MELFWGIAGTGKISNDFVVALRTLDANAHKIVAVSSRDVNKAKDFASTHDIAEAYEGHLLLAQDPKINVVYIGVVNSDHYALAKLMLENGKNVLCEKPLCTTVLQTVDLVKISHIKKLFLMEGLWSRCFPAYKELRRQLDANDIGDIQTINASLGFPLSHVDRIWSRDLGGGSLLDLGVYTLQFVQFVLPGVTPTEIIASGSVTEDIVDEFVTIKMHFPGNITANLSCNARVTLANCAEIIGTKGTIRIPDFWCPTTVKSPMKTKTFSLPTTPSKLYFHNSSGLSYEADEVRRCLIAGLTESPDMPHQESVELARWRDVIQHQIGLRYDVEF